MPKTNKRPRSEEPAHNSAAPSAAAIDAFISWLKTTGASLNGLAINANDDGSFGLFAARKLSSGTVFGNLPRDMILDPIAVLEKDKIALKATEKGGSPAFSFWLSLAAASKDPSHFHTPYLGALPRESPDPCAWPDAERQLLDGTQLATQVANQRRLLADEHRRIAPIAAPGVTFDDLLWARGVHLSRCFPRALVEAAALSTNHEVLGSNTIDSASLTVEHGSGGGGARVTWSSANEDGSVAHQPDASASASDGASRFKFQQQAKADGGQQSASAGASTSSATDAAAATADGTSEPAQVEPGGGAEHEEFAASNLGCMLPMYDMADHKVGHPIGWEAGSGGVRFRCRIDIPKGQPLFNNYGDKGNQELLFTYGFAVRDNPLDAVEGIIVGCAPDGDAAVSAERKRLLDEQGVPYMTRRTDGALLIGPFDLKPPLAASPASGGEAGEAEEEEAAASFLPVELLYALQVVGMEDVDEGPVLSLDELDLLRTTLEARLEALTPAAEADAAAAWGTRAGFVAAYREGQRRVLRTALEEVSELAAGAGGEGEEEEGEE